MAKIRLDRALANAALGSRKEVKELIRGGRIKRQGKVCQDPASKLDEDELGQLSLDDTALSLRFTWHLLLHKPAGYLTAMEDARQAHVAELLPPRYLGTGIFPVGRLDIDTTGLLLFTNDGTLGYRLTHPQWHIEKTYQFHYEGEAFTQEDVAACAAGLQLGDLRCQSAVLCPGPDHEAYLRLHEGKFHQVKRMVAALGRRLLTLCRIAQGPLTLDKTPQPGMFRLLDDAEIIALYQAVELPRPPR